MGNHALDKASPLTLAAPRSVWESYQKAKWGWHVVVPLGLAGVAAGFLSWAWTMLDQNEFGVAMLLVIFFLVIGIGASLAILKRTLKVVALAMVVMITAFSGLKILKEKGDKPWTSLMEDKVSTQSPEPTPLLLPTPMPTVAATPSPFPTPTPTRVLSSKPKQRTVKRKRPCTWEDTLLGRC